MKTHLITETSQIFLCGHWPLSGFDRIIHRYTYIWVCIWDMAKLLYGVDQYDVYFREIACEFKLFKNLNDWVNTFSYGSLLSIESIVAFFITGHRNN